MRVVIYTCIKHNQGYTWVTVRDKYMTDRVSGRIKIIHLSNG